MSTVAAASARTPPSVAIVGAGLTGISVAKACQDKGLPFTVYEKAAEVGGTWRDNVYPGIGVDSPAGWYNLPFAPKFDWSRRFAPGREIQTYLCTATSRAGLRPAIRFGTEVTRAAWREGRWQLDLADGGTASADVLVLATGFLRVPLMPNLEGRDEFAGPSFHSSRWDTSLDPRGKRIGVVGMGSSGIQITTALGQMDCRVTQFIRTPQWVNSVENTKNGWLTRQVFRAFPGYGQRVIMRRLMRLITEDPRLGKNGDWRRFPGPARDEAFAAFRADLDSVKDPVLRSKLTPTDLPGCRRTPIAPGYYAAIQKPNVTIVRDDIKRVRPEGVEVATGELHQLDVLVYATGFETHAYFNPMSVLGLASESLGEIWKRGPFAYRSVMVPDFPNLFVLHGPYAPINNITTPLSTEDQTGFLLRVIDYIDKTGTAVSPTPGATQRHLDWVRDALVGTTYASGCASWYTAVDGYQLLWPFARQEHQAMYAGFEPDDCVVVSRAAARA